MRDSSTRFEVRKMRVRSKIARTSSECPRLSIFKSNQHIYAQIIDCDKVIASASSVEKDLKQMKKSNCNKAMAEKIGALIAKRALEKSVTKVVFDRSGYKYHGVVKVLADAARNLLSF